MPMWRTRIFMKNRRWSCICPIILCGFLPLLPLLPLFSSSAGELFCVIPSYIAEHLKKRLAARKFLLTVFNLYWQLQLCHWDAGSVLQPLWQHLSGWSGSLTSTSRPQWPSTWTQTVAALCSRCPRTSWKSFHQSSTCSRSWANHWPMVASSCWPSPSWGQV